LFNLGKNENSFKKTQLKVSILSFTQKNVFVLKNSNGFLILTLVKKIASKFKIEINCNLKDYE
jgi:hypothetical protein